jgi:hypothetical protein
MKVSTKPGSIKAGSIWKSIFEIPFNQSLLSTDSYTEDLTKVEALTKAAIQTFKDSLIQPENFKNIPQL